MDKEVILLIKKKSTKKKFRELMRKQRVQVGFNTGTRTHADGKTYRRHAKHKKRADESYET